MEVGGGIFGMSGKDEIPEHIKNKHVKETFKKEIYAIYEKMEDGLNSLENLFEIHPSGYNTIRDEVLYINTEELVRINLNSPTRIGKSWIRKQSVRFRDYVR